MTKQINNITIYILMFNLFIIMNGVGLIIPVMPALLETFNAGEKIYGILIAGFALAQFIFSPLAGELSDKHGRRPFIIGGLIVFGLANILLALADSVPILFFARFLCGFGAAFVTPPVMAYVVDITTPEERGKGMGMLGAAMSLGFTIGPGIGGALSAINLVFPFYFASVAAIIASIFSYFVLPSVKPTVAIEEKPIAKRERLFKQLARSTKTSYFMFLVIAFVFSFGISNFQSTISLYLNEKFNYSPFDISLILVIGGSCGVILQMFIISKLFKKYGEMPIVLINLVVGSVATLLTIYVSGYLIILTVTTIFMIATTFIRPAINTLISKIAGKEQGFAAGMNNSYMNLGNIVGPLLAGTLHDWNYNSPYVFGAIVLILCFSMAYHWASRKAPELMKANKLTPIKRSR